ncbi:hypothetical protein [Rariglobus hedericola]|uniref:Uncharacterized protein n=1 Tax=Rariglobus hedericola TaxID=2597822 RepID=A0A556QJW5_9BACT|nr:hypothetical protein [Rariglobus hedericola]TSJ76940.1 hypothetical protein FPL22_12550 [Rariglobus hedericola]
MSATPRLIVELAPYFVRAAVVVNDRVVTQGEFAADDAAGVSTFVTEHAPGAPVSVALLAPASGIATLVSAEEAAGMRTADAFLARAAGGGGARVAVCDAAKGVVPVGDGVTGVLMAGITAEAEAEARARLTTLGLSPLAVTAALPAELGGVVQLLSGRPATESVAVWVPGESAGKVWIVSSAGIRAVCEVAVGFTQIFEAVQAELGLKFRMAASKLFLSGEYDFSETAERIGGRVGAAILTALDKETPAALHVVGLTAGQSWLAAAVAKSIELPVWTPAEAIAAARYGVSSEHVSSRVSGLLQAAAAGQVGGAWLPVWLTPGAAMPVAIAEAVVPVAPVPVPAIVRPAAAAPVLMRAPAPAPAQVKPVPPKPVAIKPVEPAVAKPATPKPVAAKAPLKSAITPAPAATTGKKFPLVPVIAGVVGVVLLAGGAMFFLKPSAEKAKSAAATASVASVKPAATGPAVKEASGLDPALQRVLLESELKRDPVSFKNDHYGFAVSPKGVLVDLKATGRASAWVKNLGFMRLYGVSLGADGRKVVRKAGDMGSPDYRARVLKQVRDGAIVFDVEVVHPKFLLRQTYTCLPHSVKVNVRFKPTGLSDKSGTLDAVYGVHLGSTEFTAPGALPVVRTGEVAYATKAGALSLRYDPAFTGAGSKPVVADPELVSFVLAVAGGTTEQVLSYEIVLP